MDKLFFGIERKRLIYFTWKWFIEGEDHIADFEYDKKCKNKQTTLLLYNVKDEHGESLIFNLKLTQSGKEVIKFGMEQVIKLISQDIDSQKVTFFVIDEKLIPKGGQKLNKNIFDTSLKIFIHDASKDSLRQMVTHMNEFHRRMIQTRKEEQENKQKNHVVEPRKSMQVKSVKNINLTEDLSRLNRKRKLRALMCANPKALTKCIKEETKTKILQEQKNQNNEVTVSSVNWLQ